MPPDLHVLLLVPAAHGFGSGNWSRDIDLTGATHRMIEIRKAGVKGLGIFATTPIQPGTRLLSEPPVCIVDSERHVFAATRSLSNIERRDLLRLSINPVRRSAFLGWSRAAWHAFLLPSRRGHAGTSISPLWASLWQYPDLLEVFRNNNFDIGHGKQAIFRDICRLNHSCVPNGQGNFNKNLDRFTIHAIKPIAPGEEVTISYLKEYGAPREHRQGRLKHDYGFLCDCAACDTSTARGRVGEAKRIALREKLRTFAEDAERHGGSDSGAELDIMEAMLETYASEGIAGREIATMHIAAAELSFKLGQDSRARGHARRGLRLDREALGDDSDLLQNTLDRYSKIVAAGTGNQST